MMRWFSDDDEIFWFFYIFSSMMLLRSLVDCDGWGCDGQAVTYIPTYSLQYKNDGKLLKKKNQQSMIDDFFGFLRSYGLRQNSTLCLIRVFLRSTQKALLYFIRFTQKGFFEEQGGTRGFLKYSEKVFLRLRKNKRQNCLPIRMRSHRITYHWSRRTPSKQTFFAYQFFTRYCIIIAYFTSFGKK